MIIQFTLQSITDGSYMTGQASATTVYISKDGGSYAATTNSVSEIGRGSYKVELTSAEATFSDVLLYQPVCTGAQINTLTIEKPVDVSNLATTSDLSAVATNVSAVKVKTDALPEHPAAVGSEMALTSAAIAAAQNGLATSDALSTVDGVVDAIKTKTDNLPASPAAVGSEMALTSAAVSAVQSGLSTFNPSNTAVIINSEQAASMRTATGFTTPEQLSTATQAIIQAMPSTSSLATSADLTSATNSILSILNLVFSGLYHWTVNDTLLTVYNSTNVPIGAYTITKNTAGEITAITPIVTTTNAD